MKKVFNTISIIALILIIANSIMVSGAIFSQQTNTGGATRFAYDNSERYNGAKLTSTITGNATNLIVYIKSSGTPTSDVNISIRADSGSNTPSSTDLATATISNYLINSGSFIGFNLTLSSPIGITANNSYWIVFVSSDGSVDTINYFIYDGYNPVSNTGLSISSDGSSWNTYSTNGQATHTLEGYETIIPLFIYEADDAGKAIIDGIGKLIVGIVSIALLIGIIIAGAFVFGMGRRMFKR